MEDCIFCKIVNSEIPAELLHEDDYCVVFRDIKPKTKTHLLIVSRKHIPSVADMDDADAKIAGHMILCAKHIAKKLRISAYKLEVHVGKEAGQEIFHIHIHLMSNFD